MVSRSDEFSYNVMPNNLAQIEAYEAAASRRVLVHNQTCRCISLRFQGHDGVMQK